MIATLEGELVESTPVQALLVINGIGYEVNIPVTTAEKLPEPGQSVKLYTLPVYREDAQTLYGFYSREDREFFRLLIGKVAGIGPKIALSILSKLSVAALKGAIAKDDVALLSQCPGIGKKTAERLVIELRDKVFPSCEDAAGVPNTVTAPHCKEGPAAPAAGSLVHDAIAALTALGYKAPEADKAVRRALERLDVEPSLEVLIKNALV